jgi:DeoR/GlpR family transcriptional regulator of sugar metabolism
MFPEERHSHILHLLESQGRVRVADLARELSVAEETVRRDLERLGQDGRLQRIHGGALPGSGRREQPFSERRDQQQAEKSRMARTAATHVAPGQIIAFDGSTSAYATALLLPDVPLTVITTSLSVVDALSTRSAIRLVCTGGTYDPTSRSFFGPQTLHMLEHLNIHLLFLSCIGVDLERGLSESTDELAAVKRALMQRAERSILLADHSKLGFRSAITFADLRQVDTLITDQGADGDLLTGLRGHGLRVCCA